MQPLSLGRSASRPARVRASPAPWFGTLSRVRGRSSTSRTCSPACNQREAAIGRPRPSTVVRELHREVVVLTLHQRDHGLEVVALLAGHPELVTLHLDLDALRAFVADQLADLLGVLLGDALLERDAELGVLAGLAGVAGLQDLQGLVALDQLVLEHVQHGQRSVVGVRGDLDPVLARPLDRRAGVLEVEPLADLALGLVDGVVDLLLVELADDVERRVGHELRFLPGRCDARFSHQVGLLYSFVSLSLRLTGVSMAGCPSGQWKRTVNPSLYSYAGSNPAPATELKRASDLGVCPSE